MHLNYVLLRFWAILKKEFITMKGDYPTYVILVLIPFIQVIIFGAIINNDAKNLPTMIVAKDNSQFTNSLVQSFLNTGYFDVKGVTIDETLAEAKMNKGEINFIINIPPNFTRDLVRNNQPHVLIEGDATDPVLVGNVFNAINVIKHNALARDEVGTFSYLAPKTPEYIIDTHSKYNPSTKAQFHTLPGLLTTILTVSLAILTAISITGEYESGTMEMLLITPINPFEVVLGKIFPNILLGYILFFLVLIIVKFFFHVPFEGSLLLLTFCALFFFIANLGVGIATSCVATNQFMAANIVNVYTLPSILFSGFLFPFAAMPQWAQYLGNLFPSTHFLRISSDIMLKGAGFTQIWPNLWPILLFIVGILSISYRFYRKTLD